MLKTRVLVGLAVGSLVLLGNLVPAWAAPPPSIRDMLAFEPKQKGVVISTPAADEINACVIEAVKDNKGDVRGWLLLDGKKQPCRRFFNSTGAKDAAGNYKIDVYA